MKLTIGYIERSFDKYNEKYFGGSLIKPTFRIIHGRRMLGHFKAIRRGNAAVGGYVDCGYIISISDFYDRCEKDYDNTIIHEMIHQYIRQNGIRQNGPHGHAFKKECDRINRDGWNLARCTNISSWKVSEENQEKIGLKTYSLCIFKSVSNGKHMIFRFGDSKVSYYEKILNRMCIKDYVFFTSKNNVFETFPCCCNRIRGWYVEDRKEFSEYMEMLKKDAAV